MNSSSLRIAAIAALLSGGCVPHVASPPVGPWAIAAADSVARAPSLSSGPGYSCAVRAGQVFCWGADDHGQLGDDAKVNRATPVPVAGVGAAVGVRSGEGLACAFGAGGTLTCWGDGFAPRAIAGITDALDAAVSFRLVCVVHGSGRVTCAGLPWRYEDKAKDRAPVVTEVAGVDDAVAIASTRRETCVVRRAGGLACFSSDSVPGRSDRGPAAAPLAPAPFQTPAPVSRLAGNDDQFCAALRDGRVACWKDRSVGGPRPVELVGGISDAISVSVGQSHRCALRRSGGVSCWGLDVSGALGSSARPRDDKTPVAVQDVADAEELSAGASFSCVRRRGGAVACWGSGDNGALGDGSSARIDQPITVAGIRDAVAVAAGRGFSCALDRRGAVWCWGHGDRSTSPDVVPPKRVPALQGATALHAQRDRLWAMRGDHLLGILGIADLARDERDGTQTAWLPPVLNQAVAFAEIDQGLGAALLAGGQVVLWVEAVAPKVGFKATPVRGLDDAVALAGDARSVCAVRRHGHVTCVVLSDAAFGAPVDLSAARIVNLPGVADAVAVAAADGDYAAVLRSGAVARWRVESGGVTGTQLDPFARGVAALALAPNFACTLLRGGQVTCAGSNVAGELGAGVNRPGPLYIQSGGQAPGAAPRGWVAVKGLDDAVAVAAGVDHACAVRRDGRVVCWGDNSHLEVGAPFPPFSSRPVNVARMNGP